MRVCARTIRDLNCDSEFSFGLNLRDQRRRKWKKVSIKLSEPKKKSCGNQCGAILPVLTGSKRLLGGGRNE